jgi:hypothetical protein
MSSLMLVSSAEQVDAPTTSTAPLYVGRTLLYPNLGEPLTRGAAGELPFYFSLYGAVERVKAHVVLLRGGRALAEAPLELPPPVNARLQHVGRLPVAHLAAGTYELRVEVTAGAQQLSRTAFFTLQD